METCEGMLSLNSNDIRPEVACATPLGGKADARCIASKHRRAKMVNNCLHCWMNKLRWEGKWTSFLSVPLETESTHEDLW